MAGVAGALSAAALITLAGPLWALALHPPAYLLGAWLFRRVRLPEKTSLAPPGFTLASALRERLREYVRGVKEGARLVLGDARLRWVAVALVLPQILHRLFEGLVMPVYAKKVLLDPGAAGFLLTASCLGELIGAALLLRYAAKIKAPTWVRRGAAAVVLVWALAFTHSLPLILPVILVMSMTWSAGDLSLRSEVQSAVSEKDQPRATSFLYSLLVLGSAAASFALGALFDGLALAPALYGVFALFTVLAAAVFYASRRLSAKKT